MAALGAGMDSIGSDDEVFGGDALGVEQTWMVAGPPEQPPEDGASASGESCCQSSQHQLDSFSDSTAPAPLASVEDGAATFDDSSSAVSPESHFFLDSGSAAGWRLAESSWSSGLSESGDSGAESGALFEAPDELVHAPFAMGSDWVDGDFSDESESMSSYSYTGCGEGYGEGASVTSYGSSHDLTEWDEIARNPALVNLPARPPVQVRSTSATQAPGVSGLLTAIEAPAAPISTARKALVEQVMASITERASTKVRRQQMWAWAEILLQENDYEFLPRPYAMSERAGVFREDMQIARRPIKKFDSQPDRWINSGGRKGASHWPSDNPRICCQYGKVVPRGVYDKHTYRYQMYTFIEPAAASNTGQAAPRRKHRKLFVVTAKDCKANNNRVSTIKSDVACKTTTTTSTLTAHAGRKQHSEAPLAVQTLAIPPARSCPVMKRIDGLITSLEQHQAHAADPDPETLYELLMLLTNQPEEIAQEVTRTHGRPRVLNDLPDRYIFAEIGTGKRRTEARKLSMYNGAVTRPVVTFDKYLNGGGKRAVVNLRTASGAVVQRRAGRLSRPAGAKVSGTDWRYFQYAVGPKDEGTKSKIAGGDQPTVYRVYAKGTKFPKLMGAVQGKRSRHDALQQKPKKEPQQMLLSIEPGHQSKRRKDRRASVAAAALTGLGAIMLYLGSSVFGGSEAPETPTASNSFDIGKCAPGFFLSSSAGLSSRCMSHAESTICDSYESRTPHDEAAGSEQACVDACASMGTDACNAISYNSRNPQCVAFRSCVHTTTDTRSIHVAGWATVWLRAADQPPTQTTDTIFSTPQWSTVCYGLTSRIAKRPMDPRCTRCDDCGGDYNLWLPCNAVADAVCYSREKSWDHVTNATMQAGERSKVLVALNPPQYAATWQTDAAIYAFGGSDSQWADTLAPTAFDGQLQCYTNAGGVSDGLWRLDRSRTPHIAPKWTLVGWAGETARLTTASHPLGRAAAASWSAGADIGAIFSGQFDLCIDSIEMDPPAPPGSYYVPPNSLFRFDEKADQWSLLGGLDTWQLLHEAQIAQSFANGFMRASSAHYSPEVRNQWPLPRSHTQTFTLDGLTYMFSGLFHMVDATTLSHDDQVLGLQSGAQTKNFLLNDFWVFDVKANYEVARTFYATRIAQCAAIVDHPEIMPRDSAYPGPRRSAATWSASVDVRGFDHDRTLWLQRGFMFGGIGRRVSLSGSTTPGVAEPTKAGGAHSCVAEQLNDDGSASPELAQVTNLCDLWSFSQRDGWNILHACSRDAKILYSLGLSRLGSTGLPWQPWENWAVTSPNAPAASVLSTTWVEYDWQWVTDMHNRATPDRMHAETILRMFGGVTHCESRHVRHGSSSAGKARNLSHQLANYSMCDVLDEKTSALLEPLAPAQCSSELWSFSTSTQAWTRTVDLTKSVELSSAPSQLEAGFDEGSVRWPPAQCGAYRVSGPIPPWHGIQEMYAMGTPLYPSQIDDYQAAEGVHQTGRSSMLLAGGWNGASTGHCIRNQTGTGTGISSLPRSRRAPVPTVQGHSLHPMHSTDVINAAGNEGLRPPTATCFSATDMWRWEAPRSSVTAV